MSSRFNAVHLGTILEFDPELNADPEHDPDDCEDLDPDPEVYYLLSLAGDPDWSAGPVQQLANRGILSDPPPAVHASGMYLVDMVKNRTKKMSYFNLYLSL
jgi:hypothetical protein